LGRLLREENKSRTLKTKAFSMRTVKDIVESKPKASNFIKPTSLVIDALQLLSSVNLSYLVVMDGGEYKGIFSERDYTRNVILKGRSSKETTVEDVMTKVLPKVKLTETVEQCMNLMNTHGSRYLLAFDNNRFVGVITIHDLLRQVIANKSDVFDEAVTKKLLDNYESGRIY
jgi:predicted transcriptional regulator